MTYSSPGNPPDPHDWDQAASPGPPQSPSPRPPDPPIHPPPHTQPWGPPGQLPAGYAPSGDGPGGGSRTGLLIALGVIVLAVVGGGAFLLLRDDDSSSEAISQSSEEGAEAEEDDEVASTTTTTSGGGNFSDSSDGPGTGMGEDGGLSGQSGQSGTAPTSASPEATVETYFVALQANDCQAMVEMLSESVVAEEGGASQMVADCETHLGSMDLSSLSVGDPMAVSETERNAVVEVPVVYEGEPATDTLTLVFESGGWRISDWQ